MLHFPQRNNATPQLYADETDAPLPETLNPKIRYAYFSTIAMEVSDSVMPRFISGAHSLLQNAQA